MDLSLVTSNLLQFDISSQGGGGRPPTSVQKKMWIKIAWITSAGGQCLGIFGYCLNTTFTLSIIILFWNTSATTYNTYHIHK